MKECLPVPSFEDEHSKVLITLMSSLIDEDSFQIDPDSNTLQPKSDFLKDIEESIEKGTDDGQVAKDRLIIVKNKLIERVRESTSRNKGRRLSISSVDSETRKRRMSSKVENDREAVKSKTSPLSV